MVNPLGDGPVLYHSLELPALKDKLGHQDSPAEWMTTMVLGHFDASILDQVVAELILKGRPIRSSRMRTH